MSQSSVQPSAPRPPRAVRVPPPSGLAYAVIAVVAELFILTTWVGSALTGSMFATPGGWFLVLFVLPPVAVGCAVAAVVVGHRDRDVRHRAAFWIGVGTLVPAVAALAIGVLFVIGEALIEG